MIKQELNISMFVPAVFEDGKWVVLEKHLSCAECLDNPNLVCDYCKEEYQKALDNVLFSGFKVTYNSDVIQVLECGETKMIFAENDPLCLLEHVADGTLTLTENALKQIYGK